MRKIVLIALISCGNAHGEPANPPSPSAPSSAMAGGGGSAAPSNGDEPTYETRVHQGGGIAFELGSDWNLKGAETEVLLASSPDGQAVLMFHVVPPEKLDEVLAAIDKALRADIQDVFFRPATEKKLGEMTAELASGAGKLEGRPVELGKLLVATPNDKVLVVVAVVEVGAPPTSKRQARHTLESIRPQP